jgi:hypothetical protein
VRTMSHRPLQWPALKRDFANEMPAHAVTPAVQGQEFGIVYSGMLHRHCTYVECCSSAPNRQLFGQNGMKSGREGTLQLMPIAKNYSRDDLLGGAKRTWPE